MKTFKAMGAAKASRQRGFTIIELVVVILLLGILTATALPRFLDISEEAHDAVVDGVQGGLQTGLALYKANWYALSQPTTALADWGSLVPNSEGYPVDAGGGTSSGLVDAHTDCDVIYSGLMDINAGAPTIDDAFAIATTTFTSDTTATDMTDDALVEAEGDVGDFDFVANWTSSDTDNCEFWYIGDAQRLTTATAPKFTYDTVTGILTRDQ